MKPTYLILFILCVSCASKKHTLSFQNSPQAYSKKQSLKIDANDTTLAASIDIKPELKGDESSVIQKLNSVQIYKQVDSTVFEKQDATRDSTLMVGGMKKVNEKNSRKIEHLGLLGFILVLLAIAVSFIIPILSFLLFVVGGILGFSSMKRIKRNKNKWKGKAFGAIAATFLIVYGVLAILAIGLALSGKLS